MSPSLGHDDAIYRNIFANMSGGVMCVDRTGRVMTFNRAAGEILGLLPEEVVGRTFAELFLADETLDAFNELVLRAIYEQSLTHRHELAVDRAGRHLTLSVSTTFLRTESDGEPIGVIVVFSDETERRKRRKLKRLFGEYLDPRILDRLLATDSRLGAGAERREMTVAFCDLAAFTTLAEMLEPTILVQFLNAYVGRMTKAVAATGGVTDKIIGDAVMAFWGPPFTPEDHALAACNCARHQVEALTALAGDARGLGLASRPEIRIGIATGEVILGSIGAPGARSFTVVGDTVNVAARLEAANKELGTQVIVSAATRNAVGDRYGFRELGDLHLRGRARPEPVYTLDDSRGS